MRIVFHHILCRYNVVVLASPLKIGFVLFRSLKVRDYGTKSCSKTEREKERRERLVLKDQQKLKEHTNAPLFVLIQHYNQRCRVLRI